MLRGSLLVIMCRYLLGDSESYALQLLTPASILAGLSGRKQIKEDDISEMNELFLDAKTTSAAMIESGSFGAGDS
jgi:RuvB-like protein 1